MNRGDLITKLEKRLSGLESDIDDAEYELDKLREAFEIAEGELEDLKKQEELQKLNLCYGSVVEVNGLLGVVEYLFEGMARIDGGGGVSIEMKIVQVNVRRMQRGAEGVQIGVFENGECVDCLWMSPSDIKKNIKEFGENEAFLTALECYRLRRDVREVAA